MLNQRAHVLNKNDLLGDMFLNMIHKFNCTRKCMSHVQQSMCKCEVESIGSCVCKNQFFN